jgi:hypothetical protein
MAIVRQRAAVDTGKRDALKPIERNVFVVSR